MSGRIKADDIVYVREHAHIDEVVTAAGVALKNAGGGQKKGLCPFHDEKSPSFHVTIKELLPLLWLWRWR